MRALIFSLLLFYTSNIFANVEIQYHQGNAWIYIDSRPYQVCPRDLNVNWLSRVQWKSKYHTSFGFIYYFSCQTNVGQVFFELPTDTGVVSIGAQYYERSNAVFLFDSLQVHGSGRGW